MGLESMCGGLLSAFGLALAGGIDLKALIGVCIIASIARDLRTMLYVCL